MTNKAPKAYPKGGDIYMEGEGGNMQNPDTEPTPKPGIENASSQTPSDVKENKVGADKNVTLEARREKIKAEFEKENVEREARGEEIPIEEKRTQEMIIERGGISGGTQQQPGETPPPEQTTGAGGPEGPPPPPIPEGPTPGGENTRQEQPLSSQTEEERKLRENLKNIEDTFPEFRGISQNIINSLQSNEPHRRLEEVYRNFVSQYQNAESARTKAYAEKKYEGPNADQQRKADSEEYIKRMNALRDAQKKIIEIFGERVAARTELSLEGQAAVKTIKELKVLIDKPDIPEDIKGNLRKELQTKALKMIGELDPENRPIDDETLRAIGADDFASEKFISRIIILASEDKQYQLHGLYTAVNLNRFLTANVGWMESGKLQRLDNLARGTEVIHEMNRILKTSVEQFAQVSQTILSSHLSTVFGIHGVQDVFELYEGIIKENLSIETMVTDDVFKAIDNQVEEDFKGRVSKRVLSLKGEVGLEDWEVERALIYGRNLMRTLLREAEYISLSDLREYPENQISLAQGQLYNIFHPLNYTVRRFGLGISRGGIELLEAVLNEAAKKRRHGRNNNKEESKGIVRLNVLQGTEVRYREATTYIGTRSAIMTWRSTQAILKEFAILDKGRTSNLAQFFEDHEKEINTLNEISSENAWESEFKRTKNKYVDRGKDETNEKWEERKKKQLEDWKRARIEQVFGELLKNNAAALGVLVSPTALKVSVPAEVKEMLWEKIAELNPDVMASILTRLEVDEAAEGAGQLHVKSLEEILVRHFGTEDQKRLLFEAKVSDELQKKINPEELRDPIIALLKREFSLEQQIQIEKDDKTKEGLKKDLQKVRNSLRWKPTLAKRDLTKAQEEYDKLEGELAKTTGESGKGKLREKLEEAGRKRDAKKREFNILDTQVKQLLRYEKWITIRGKLRTINRLRMMDETERIRQAKSLEGGKLGPVIQPKRFQDYLDDPRLLEGDRLDTSEKKVVVAISENGKQIAQDLANIKQATIWFLDDVPTDISKWENLGQFFNRTIGDFGAFSQASNEMVQFFSNPFKVPVEKALEHIEKAIDSAGQAIGPEASQDNLNSIVMMYNRWIQTYPRYRQKFIEMLASGAYKLTSKAQEVTGDTGAPSLDEETMFNTLLTENNKSILRPEKKNKYGKVQFTDSFKAAVKELKVGTWNRMIWANVRDWGPFFLLGLLMQLFKETTADTKR